MDVLLIGLVLCAIVFGLVAGLSLGYLVSELFRGGE